MEIIGLATNMDNDPREDTFNFMKSLGYFKQYATYKDYTNDNFRGEAEKKIKFVDTLSPEEQEQYKFVFGK